MANERRRQLLLRKRELLMKKAQVSTPLDIADITLGKAVETAGGRLFPQEEGIAKTAAEAALTTAGGFVPGGRAAAGPFLKDPATRAVMGVGAGLATAPAVTLGGLGGGLVGEALAPEGRKNIAGIAGGLVGGGIGAGVGAVARNIAGKAAGGIINSLIKPKAKAYQYGKNPGQEVARQGIKGNSFEQLGKNIDTRIEGLNTEVANIVAKSKSKVNLQSALKPIHTMLDKLKQNPRTNATAINKVQGFLDDIIGITRNVKGQITAKRPISKMSASEAVKIKQGIGRVAKFTGVDDPPAFSAVVHQVYHAMRTQIENAVPGTAKLNSSIANLIGASKAIGPSIARAAKQQAGGMLSLKSILTGGAGALAGGGPGAVTGVAINQALSRPATATRIGAGLAKAGKGGLLRGLLRQ